MKIVLLTLALALVACGNRTPEEWTPVPPGELTPVQKVRFEQARLLVKTLGAALMQELMSAMGGDAADAIKVCREVAPRLTADISADPEVEVGRTSHRLRNAGNRPPEWLANLQAVEPQVYIGPNDEMGVALPITAKRMCLTCHGSTEEIDAAVLAKIGEHYPQDKATGFAEGDLRGQFWVELAAPKE